MSLPEKPRDYSGKKLPFINTIITTFGAKFLRILTGGGDNLQQLSNNFVNKVGIDPENNDYIQTVNNFFAENNSGLIILNHQNYNFSDYLPLIKDIPDEKLRKTKFFAVNWTSDIFKKELGNNYDILSATPTNFSETKKLINSIKEITEKLNGEEGGYIFLIPSGADSKNANDFKGIFTKIINKLNINTPILAGNINYKDDIGYGEIYKRLLKGNIGENKTKIIPEIKATILKVSDFIGKSGVEAKKIYDEAFKS